MAFPIHATLSAYEEQVPILVSTNGVCSKPPILKETFRAMEIAAARLGNGHWIAHTPGNKDFGDAQFVNPGSKGPFALSSEGLTITASKNTEGHWTSGLIAAADDTGAGFASTYGHFESVMKLPSGAGTWPAFWLVPLPNPNVDQPTVEIDVMEYYGQFPSWYQVAIHVWNKDPTKTRTVLQKIDVPDGSLTKSFHVYSVDIDEKLVVFRFDGKLVWTQPTPPELNRPMFPLVDLALGGGWPIKSTPSPSVLSVRSVEVDAPEHGKGC